MINNRLVGLLGLITILSACSYRTAIPLETLEPPTSFYINPTQPITITYSYVPSNQLPKILGKVNDNDSIAADVASYVIASSFKENSLYPQTNVVTSQHLRNDSLVSQGFILTEQEISKIAMRTGGKVILSLDYLAINPEITTFPSANGGYNSFLAVNAVALWRTYSVESKQVVGEYLFKKSYSWDAGGSSKALALSNLPNMSEIASWVGSECGKSSAGAFVPFWTTVYRNLFVSPEAKWSQARSYVKMGDWKSATKIWSWQVGENRNVKQRWQAAYNLAVASEVQNDLMLALDWLDLADSFIPNSSEVEEYREIIQLRLKSQKIIESYK